MVILGAGFGGLRAAILIAKKLRALHLLPQYEVVLIDHYEYHTYTPLLYEVATTSKETADATKLHEVATYAIGPLIAHLPITFVQAEVESLDVREGRAYLKDKGEIHADYMVIALGSETNFFNIPGVEKHAFTLKTFLGALKIREAISKIAQGRAAEIRIVIGGGGSTGVELAGEIKNWCGQLVNDGGRCHVAIVEAAPTILNDFEPRVIALVKKRLALMGVETIEGRAITSANEEKIILKGGRLIPYDIFVWTGGVKAPAVLARVPLKKETQGRVVVVGQMECLPQTRDLRLYGKIYGLGDSICFSDPLTKKSVPLVARAAISEANVVAHNIIEDIRSETGARRERRHRTYRHMGYPYVIPIGGKYAVARVGPLIISGFFGWVLKGLVELHYLISLVPLSQALRIWFTGLKIFIKNDRLG